MDYEWDEKKRQQNVAKHGVDFGAIAGFDWKNAVIVPDQRRIYGEARFVALGKIGNRLHICVYTQRNGIRRIISLRKANNREEEIYEKAAQTTH